MSKNYIGLENNKIEGIVKSLNDYLANLNLLYIKIHNLHWNVQGHSFFQLHTVFEGYYEGVAKSLDAVAERILTLGDRPLASMKEYLEIGTIKELESKGLSGDEAIGILEADFLAMLNDSRELISMAEDAKDQGTIDLMAGLIAEYEKTLWMIKSYKA
ncbi:DNA starvation/stationary phase protection protein [Clostridium sp. AL.422]|uniref:Dps family protein n=1 Tax=Clostridium TaxID=1485 RepID=UPI00293DEA32|nr:MULTISPECIES: DNA starvation/stationary phase protection protein [unclassified Clostridium]MDV4149594.1 DNA starvation/stationary phase protection protein [Clostridium sp. AL.422]